MSSVKCLQEKLFNHLEKIEPEARRLRTERAAFNRKVMELFEHLEEVLGSTKGVALTTSPVSTFGNVNAAFMEILILDKTVRIQPIEAGGRFTLGVSGLFDRKLEFSLQDDEVFIASDQACSTEIFLDDALIFRGLCGLVPE
ncbi:hypothetical protein [Pseudomonas sp. CIP-10]|uniref:hypothetical protein n=1 Tax=Pseudomonas sp. CIP-10 TaxID=2892442 RepID=UPI001E5F5AE2|nr:hypothetical protein [Pseudomonas sp. CIP-10]UFH28841.1 hypothetical protein LMH93_09640 [Pseudomonas sp. CIP-10]